MIRYLLLLLFFVMFIGGPLGLHESIVTGISIKNAFLYVLVIIFGIETAITGNRRLEIPSVLIPFSLFFAYSLFSYLVVVFIIDYADYSKVESGIRLKTGLLDHILMLLVFFYGAAKTKDAMWLIRMAVWLVMLANIVTLADAFELPDLEILDLGYQDRLQGFIGQQNQFGGFLAFFLPPAIGVFFFEAGYRRVAAGVGVAATFFCLILTFSRGAMVGAIIGAIIAGSLLRNYISSRTFVSVVLTVLLAFAVSVPLLFVTGYGDVFLDRVLLTRGDSHTISQGRTTLWMRAISVMTENPISFITGYGWNAYYSFKEFRLSTHNAYLTYLFNLGLIGLAIVLTVYSRVLVLLRRGVAITSGDERSFLLFASFGFAAICVAMLFSETHYAGVLIWAFTGLVLRVTANAQFEGLTTERRL